MKRFYKDATAVSDDRGGFRICLDGRPVKTPERHNLWCCSAQAAAIVVAEWQAQDANIVPETMPATRILYTMIDKIPHERNTIADLLMKYLDTDLICYRADGPEGLVLLQDELWGPWLNWFTARYGAALRTTQDLKALIQEKSAHEAVAADIAAMDDLRFTVLQSAVPVAGSLVLSLAFVVGDLDAQDFVSCLFVEEDYQAQITRADLYGDDPMIAKKKTALLRDLIAAQALLKTL